MKNILVLMVSSALVFSIGCGPKAFIKGEYQDPEKENNLNDSWSETDMQKAVQELVASLSKSPTITKAKEPPIVMITKLQNNTSEQIETQSIMDMVKVELASTGSVAFVDKEARQDIADEYNYQNSGMMSEDSKKGPGGQVGADFILNGRLESIVQEVGKDKTVYYKITLNLTDLKKNLIRWTGQKQMRKVFKKRSVGF